MSFLSTANKFIIGSIAMVAAGCTTPGREETNTGLCALELRCEGQIRPLAVETDAPELGWCLTTDEDARGESQTAYQILVASSPEKLADEQADLWDSGKVASSQSLAIVYGGKPLSSAAQCWWQVRVWNKGDHAGPWSEPALWEMGLRTQADWGASWISNPEPLPTADEELYKDRPAPLFRHEFQTTKPIARARLHISGLGFYEARLNGAKVGENWLDPGWTSYAKRVLYTTYDVTEMIQSGENAIGVMLGDGWYNPLPLKMWGGINIRQHLTTGKPRVIARLQIDYKDGSRTAVVTDNTWKTAPGPIIHNSVYLGEQYDARRESPGWDTPGFDDSPWQPVTDELPDLGQLQAQTAPPISVLERLTPVKRTEPKPGVVVYDFGRNFAGVASLRVKGPTGARVTMRSGELLYEDGMLNGMTTVCGQIKRAGVGGPGAPDIAYQSDSYTLKGEGWENYTPRFTYHGFRYVEVTCSDESVTAEIVEGLALGSAVASSCAFSCSNKMFNRIQTITRHTLQSNMFSVQSDCPAREKFGYGGDIVATSDMAMLNFDMALFYAKTVRDFQDAARSNGGLTETAPFVGISAAGFGENSAPIAWGLAHPLLIRQLYQYYGNHRLLAEQYPVARRWVELIRSQAPDHIVSRCISDHESIDPQPIPLMATAHYYQHVVLLAEMASILGKEQDQASYTALAGEISTAFVTKFLKPGTGQFGIGTQAAQACALFMGLVPEEERKRCIDHMCSQVIDKHKGHIATGIFGTKYLLDMLAQTGNIETAYAVVNQKTFPGWGHMLKNGATTLWEHWKFSDSTFSHNHPMFGSVSEWFIRRIGGISAAPDAVGFDQISIAPRIPDDLTWAKTTYQSIRGPVVCNWRKDAGTIIVEVEIPIGAGATLCVPGTGEIRESGRPVSAAAGIKPVSGQDRIFRLASGAYVFTTSL